MRSTGYKCYNIKCGSCMGKTLCGEPGDTALSCVDRLVNTQTNGDRIRSLSDKELGIIIFEIAWDGECIHWTDAEKWLKEPDSGWVDRVLKEDGNG